VAIRRELAAANPDRYRPDLDDAVQLLASILESLGRTADADAVRREPGGLATRQTCPED